LDQVAGSVLPAGSPAERLRAVIPLVAAERGRLRASLNADDVVDPFRLSMDVYAESFAQITSAVDAIINNVG